MFNTSNSMKVVVLCITLAAQIFSLYVPYAEVNNSNFNLFSEHRNEIKMTKAIGYSRDESGLYQRDDKYINIRYYYKVKDIIYSGSLKLYSPYEYERYIDYKNIDILYYENNPSLNFVKSIIPVYKKMVYSNNMKYIYCITIILIFVLFFYILSKLLKNNM